MKTFVLWCALAVAPVGLVAPTHAQDAPNLLKAPLKWPTINAGGEDDGSFYAHVAAIQYLLRARGLYKGKPTGVFDAKTVAAVKAFQRKNKLKADGVAGPQTLPKLVIAVRRGSKGDAVRATQILARGAMYDKGETPNLGLEVDGTYGKETEKAVKTAQNVMNESYALKVDGIMGMRSWCLLLGGTVVGSQV